MYDLPISRMGDRSIRQGITVVGFFWLVSMRCPRLGHMRASYETRTKKMGGPASVGTWV